MPPGSLFVTPSTPGNWSSRQRRAPRRWSGRGEPDHELDEFAPSVLDGLRQPLEEGVIRLARAQALAALPGAGSVGDYDTTRRIKAVAEEKAGRTSER